MALVAKEEARAEYIDACIKVLDSQTVPAAEGFIALVTAWAVEEGKDLDELVGLAKEIRDKVSFFFTLKPASNWKALA